MRIAIFTDADLHSFSGVATTLNAVLDHASAGVRPRIYTAARLGCDLPDYVALRLLAVPLPISRGTQIYVPKRREYLKRVCSDRIEVLHLTTPGPLGLTALWIAKETGLPLVGSFHIDIGAAPPVSSGLRRVGSWIHAYIRWMYSRCRAVLVPSAAAHAMLVALGLPEEQVVIWRRGVDTGLFDPARRCQIRGAMWRSDNSHPVLLYAGRLAREKNIDVLRVKVPFNSCESWRGRSALEPLIASAAANRGWRVPLRVRHPQLTARTTSRSSSCRFKREPSNSVVIGSLGRMNRAVVACAATRARSKTSLLAGSPIAD